jgi:hypothetical protein
LWRNSREEYRRNLVFKIVSEGAVAAGFDVSEAITGDSNQFFASQENALND